MQHINIHCALLRTQSHILSQPSHTILPQGRSEVPKIQLTTVQFTFNSLYRDLCVNEGKRCGEIEIATFQSSTYISY